MRNIKGVITTITSLSLVCCNVFSLSISAKASADITTYENIVVDEIENVLDDAYSEFYNISSITSEVSNTEVEGDTFKTEVHTTLNTILKADSVEELPFVQGMLEASGVADVSDVLNDNDKIATTSINADISDYKKAEVALAIENKFEDLEQYIGSNSEFNFWFYVDAEIENGNLDTESINIMAENIDCLIPINDILPKSEMEQKAEGIKAMQSVINSPLEVRNSNTVVSPMSYPAYRRIAARDYALAYVGQNVNSCYEHGSSCGIKQDPSYYNENFSYYLHNDCANFVSQCLNAGDVWYDNTWYPDSYAWINTQGLKNYMLNTKGYWYASNFANANAGSVLYTSSSHVVLITLNDTVTHRYTGHTNDRHNTVFTNVSGYEYYML